MKRYVLDEMIWPEVDAVKEKSEDGCNSNGILRTAWSEYDIRDGYGSGL